ncbi:uncharacterized protein HPF63_0086 [Helicobacter pylori]|nr:uncharacterized protein HPF63_0086 [Helicobacter pylori]
MVEHYLDMVVAAGSSPVVATIIALILILISSCFLWAFDLCQMILKGIKRAYNNAFMALLWHFKIITLIHFK